MQQQAQLEKERKKKKRKKKKEKEGKWIWWLERDVVDSATGGVCLEKKSAGPLCWLPTACVVCTSCNAFHQTVHSDVRTVNLYWFSARWLHSEAVACWFSSRCVHSQLIIYKDVSIDSVAGPKYIDSRTDPRYDDSLTEPRCADKIIMLTIWAKIIMLTIWLSQDTFADNLTGPR